MHRFAYLTSALARLPKLHTVSLKVDNSPENNLPMVPFSTMLYSLHTQLPGVAELSLQFTEGLNSSMQPWYELCRATKLTRLELRFDAQVDEPWSLAAGYTMPLCGLTGLQSLSITARGQQQRQALSADWAFLYALTALTGVDLSMATCRDICSLCACKALQSVIIHDLESAPPEDMNDVAWLTLGGLTKLTQLHLYSAAQRTASSAFEAAIGQLTRLESVGAGIWAPEALPVLQTLPRLECIIGGWEAGDSGGACLTHVRRLANCSGEVPFEAFTHLTQIRQSGAFSTAALSALGKHCTGLVELCLTALDSVRDPRLALCAEPAKERSAALQSLGSLRHLTRLDFAPRDDVEVVAVAAAASALLQTGSLQNVCLRGFQQAQSARRAVWCS